MRFATYASAAALLCLLYGCADNEAKNAVKGLLNDPGSAQFSSLVAGKNSGDVCGLVNAKNRMGGYVGNTPFFFEKATGTTGMVTSPTESDFRSLWLSIKIGSFGEDLAKLGTQCQLMDRWDSVCKNPHPQSKHKMCAAIQGGGKGLYETLRWEYDR